MPTGFATDLATIITGITNALNVIPGATVLVLAMGVIGTAVYFLRRVKSAIR